jgi:Fe-S oxidoreductase
MATYKAEFRAHHYKGRLRPRGAYSMGLIHWWAGWAATAPWLVNAVMQAPFVSRVAKWAGGIAPKRRVPTFAGQTFRSWWADRGGAWVEDHPVSRGEDGQPTAEPRRVILWADTFNDHFHPAVAKAAVAVLEDAGCEVVVPKTPFCCGRPLYDWGFLGQARHLLSDTIAGLRADIRAGTPIVGLEPSCVSVFRDEAPNLLHGDADVRRLSSQTQTLTEFLASLDGYRPPAMAGRALVHGHCHHKSVLNFDAELRVLAAMGLETDTPETGCCGMAGAFGFERGEHYDVSVAAGERVLLPAVRAAASDELVITGGFSCREQIEQGTERTVLHPAEVLARAIQTSGGRRGDVTSQSADDSSASTAGPRDWGGHRQAGDPARRTAGSSGEGS